MKNAFGEKEGLNCPDCPFRQRPAHENTPRPRRDGKAGGENSTPNNWTGPPQPDGSERLRLFERLALRPKELAAALGVGERTVRALLPEIPHLRVGGVVLIPVKPAERWLEEQMGAQQRRTNAVVEEVVHAIRKDYD